VTFLPGERVDTFPLLANQNIRGNIFLGLAAKTCYGEAAFVALVTPLDSFEGAASNTCGLFLFYGWRRSRSTNSLKEK
jgi:hypothetical protein